LLVNWPQLQHSTAPANTALFFRKVVPVVVIRAPETTLGVKGGGWSI
jgi:hypothetical protein